MNKLCSGAIHRTKPERAFTFIELVISLAILAILASVALPLAEISVKRSKELQLRQALREIRIALDTYKSNYDKGVYGPIIPGASGYPKSLQELVDKKVLRRIPKDPMTENGEWGTRSYTDMPNSYFSNKLDVYDIFTKSEDKALDGSSYKEW